MNFWIEIRNYSPLYLLGITRSFEPDFVLDPRSRVTKCSDTLIWVSWLKFPSWYCQEHQFIRIFSIKGCIEKWAWQIQFNLFQIEIFDDGFFYVFFGYINLAIRFFQNLIFLYTKFAVLLKSLIMEVCDLAILSIFLDYLVQSFYVANHIVFTIAVSFGAPSEFSNFGNDTSFNSLYL